MANETIRRDEVGFQVQQLLTLIDAGEFSRTVHGGGSKGALIAVCKARGVLASADKMLHWYQDVLSRDVRDETDVRAALAESEAGDA